MSKTPWKVSPGHTINRGPPLMRRRPAVVCSKSFQPGGFCTEAEWSEPCRQGQEGEGVRAKLRVRATVLFGLWMMCNHAVAKSTQNYQNQPKSHKCLGDWHFRNGGQWYLKKNPEPNCPHAIKDFLISKESYNGVSGRKKALKWILSVFQNYLSFFHSTPLFCNPNSFMDASPTKHPDSPHSCTPKPCPTPTHVYQKSAYQK